MSFLTSGRPARSSVKVIPPIKPKAVGKRKVYNLFKGYEAINYGYDQEIKRIGPITAASFDEAVEAVYGLKFPLLKRENGKYIDTDGKPFSTKNNLNFINYNPTTQMGGRVIYLIFIFCQILCILLP